MKLRGQGDAWGERNKNKSNHIHRVACLTVCALFLFAAFAVESPPKKAKLLVCWRLPVDWYYSKSYQAGNFNHAQGTRRQHRDAHLAHYCSMAE